MSSLARLTPLRDAFRLQGELDRLFGVPVRALANDAEASRFAPPVDIYEDAEGLTLSVELPGFSADEIDLRVENDTLTLKGERKLENGDKRENYRRVERSYGSFTRAFALPPTVDTEQVRADAKDGVLKVFLPRREESKPRQIKVKIDA